MFLIKVPGSEEEIPADLVLLALGFTGPEKSSLLEQLDVAIGCEGKCRQIRNLRNVNRKCLRLRRYGTRPITNRLGDR